MDRNRAARDAGSSASADIPRRGVADSGLLHHGSLRPPLDPFQQADKNRPMSPTLSSKRRAVSNALTRPSRSQWPSHGSNPKRLQLRKNVPINVQIRRQQ